MASDAAKRAKTLPDIRAIYARLVFSNLSTTHLLHWMTVQWQVALPLIRTAPDLRQELLKVSPTLRLSDYGNVQEPSADVRSFQAGIASVASCHAFCHRFRLCRGMVAYPQGLFRFHRTMPARPPSDVELCNITKPVRGRR